MSWSDELTAALDADNGYRLMHLLAGLVQGDGPTLVVVTHDNRNLPFAERALRLEDGQLADDWKRAEP